MKYFFVLIFTFSAMISRAQDNIQQYLKLHHYSFTLDQGFDDSTAIILKQKFEDYKLILLGEGGSHFLQFYEPLRFFWIKFLS